MFFFKYLLIQFCKDLIDIFLDIFISNIVYSVNYTVLYVRGFVNSVRNCFLCTIMFSNISRVFPLLLAPNEL